eukprot:scaffold1763_cov243-Prasinococcus_capsulatus_cf.AAC.3
MAYSASSRWILTASTCTTFCALDTDSTRFLRSKGFLPSPLSSPGIPGKAFVTCTAPRRCFCCRGAVLASRTPGPRRAASGWERAAKAALRFTMVDDAVAAAAAAAGGAMSVAAVRGRKREPSRVRAS